MYTIIHNTRKRKKVEIEMVKSETDRSTLQYRASLRSELKSVDNLLNFKKSLSKNFKQIEKILFSKGTILNMKKALMLSCIFKKLC